VVTARLLRNRPFWLRVELAGVRKGFQDETACWVRRNVAGIISRSRGAGSFHLAERDGHQPEDFMAGHSGAARRICETRARHRPAPELEVTITPPKVKIPDNSSEERYWPKSRFGGATESRFAVRSGSPKTQPASVNCQAWSYN
jgi:hypothetical protein